MPLYIRTTRADIRQADNNAECPLCYEAIGSTTSGDIELMMILPCGHCYGHVCLSRHLETKEDCPLCRAPLPSAVLEVVQRLTGPSLPPFRRERVRDWAADHPGDDDFSFADRYVPVLTNEIPRPGRISVDQLRTMLQTHIRYPELYGPLRETERYFLVLDPGTQQNNNEVDELRRVTRATSAAIHLAALLNSHVLAARIRLNPPIIQDSTGHEEVGATITTGTITIPEDDHPEALPPPFPQPDLRAQILALSPLPFLLAADIPWPVPLPTDPSALLLAVSFIRHQYSRSAAAEILGLMARLDSSLAPPLRRARIWMAQWHTVAEYEMWAQGLEEGDEKYELARRLLHLIFEPCERVGESVT